MLNKQKSILLLIKNKVKYREQYHNISSLLELCKIISTTENLMKKIIYIFFTVIFIIGCATTKESDSNIDLSNYKNGWDFIGINENVSIPYGTYFQTPFYTKVIEKNNTIIVLEIIGKDIFYFDMLNPKEVKRIEVGQYFSPEESIVMFPKKFDRTK